MSRATKRKHVTREVLREGVVPAPRQSIVRVLGTPGNNLHEVETPEGGRFLVSMPPRFRHHVWIKRGDFLLVDPIAEGAKVKAEMALLLLPPHVRFLQRQGLWPEAFEAPRERASEREGSGEPELFVNTNRGGGGEEEEEEEEEEDEDDEDEDGDEDEEEEEEEEEEEADGDAEAEAEGAAPQ